MHDGERRREVFGVSKALHKNLWEGSPTPKRRCATQWIVVVNEVGVGDASHRRFE
jgi:hypothetical protein